MTLYTMSVKSVTSEIILFGGYNKHSKIKETKVEKTRLDNIVIFAP